MSDTDLAELIHDEDYNCRPIFDKETTLRFRLGDDKIDIDGIIKIIDHLFHKQNISDMVEAPVSHFFIRNSSFTMHQNR